jgi:hypothetical protein
MTEVFLLWHSREARNGETDSKLIGVYSAAAEAQAAIARKLALPGFRDDPGGFLIDRYEIDRDAWSAGFGFSDREQS